MSERIPLCKHYDTCGGCSLQQLTHETQLAQKKVYVERLLNTKVTMFSQNEFHYRNRMDFIFTRHGIGLRQRGSFKSLVTIQECVIAEPKINQVLSQIQAHFADVDCFDLQKQSGTYKYATIRSTDTQCSVTFILNQDSTKISQASEKIEAFAQLTCATEVLIGFVSAKVDESTSLEVYAVKGNEYLTQQLCGKTIFFSTQGFFQNNTAMAQKMVEHIRTLVLKVFSATSTVGHVEHVEQAGQVDQVKQSTNQSFHLLDLYGGVGSFGICLADLFKSVTIVESFAPSIEMAKKNIADNRIMNASAHVLDAAQLHKLNLPTQLCVINDPPRSGMTQKALQGLLKLRAPVIIYVSCNIEQTAKELTQFYSAGYVLESVAAFDLFAQTNHIEVVLELRRKK